MIFRKYVLPIFLIIFLLSFLSGCSDILDPGVVKEPSVAGLFYPDDKEKLRETVDEFLSKAENRPVDGRLVALISPHAGYVYSGSVAAYTYNHLKNEDIETVILIGPSHKNAFNGVSVFEKGKWRTPLGQVKIDHDMARMLLNKEADVTYYPEAFEKEHSLEVQVPFIQRISEKIKIVPVLIGTPTQKSYRFLTSKLTEILRENRKAIIIASTDFSHYHDYKTAMGKDGLTIDGIERMSVEDVQKYLMSRKGEMCGSNPVLYTMTVARNLGATNGVLYKYANSGDVTGDMNRVVGYAAMGLYRTPVSESGKDTLLRLAKETITKYVKNGSLPEVVMNNKRLRVNGATFVTIKTEEGRLRGCIGNIEPTMPLYQSVIHNAVSASSRDTRFQPMKETDLEGIEVEVTILSPLEPLKNKKAVEIGRHGLYLVKDYRSGILLPQVPVEQGWDRITFLKQVSRKAGLPEDAWKEADLYSFTAEIIK